jgi:hypothetical protein
MMTFKIVKKYLPKSEATAMGHLDQQQKKTHSTKQVNSTATKIRTMTMPATNSQPTKYHPMQPRA